MFYDFNFYYAGCFSCYMRTIKKNSSSSSFIHVPITCDSHLLSVVAACYVNVVAFTRILLILFWFFFFIGKERTLGRMLNCMFNIKNAPHWWYKLITFDTISVWKVLQYSIDAELNSHVIFILFNFLSMV